MECIYYRIWWQYSRRWLWSILPSRLQIGIHSVLLRYKDGGNNENKPRSRYNSRFQRCCLKIPNWLPFDLVHSRKCFWVSSVGHRGFSLARRNHMEWRYLDSDTCWAKEQHSWRRAIQHSGYSRDSRISYRWLIPFVTILDNLWTRLWLRIHLGRWLRGVTVCRNDCN